MRTRLRWILLDRIELTLQTYAETELFVESNGVFILPDSYFYADADSCAEKVTMHDNGLALRSASNGYRTHLQGRIKDYP